MLQLRFYFLTVGVAIATFLGMLIFLELGRRIGLAQFAKRGKDSRIGIGVIDSAVYALLALFLGFTFSGAAGRFDQRRQLIADEVNVAGTAWQRVDVLPVERQEPVREGFRRYVDALVAWYREAPGAQQSALNEPPAVTQAQREVWTRSVAATLAPGGDQARMLLLPSLNEMFGAVEKERMARRMHPPSVIWIMLGITAMAAALFAGYGLASGARNWIYTIGLATAIALATYVIVELEFPRLGLFRVNAMDQTLVELRASME